MTIDQLSALLFELTPGAAVQVTKTLRLGAGWRVSMLEFRRVIGAEANPNRGNVDLNGVDFSGWRAGAQWTPLPKGSFGLVYRHKVVVGADAPSGMLLGQQAADVATSLVVPAKLSGGARFDHGRLGLAADLEYLFNGQNEQMTLSARLPQQGSML